jgi:hypothetical protein
MYAHYSSYENVHNMFDLLFTVNYVHADRRKLKLHIRILHLNLVWLGIYVG